jgi:hypothetical protein
MTYIGSFTYCGARFDHGNEHGIDHRIAQFCIISAQFLHHFHMYSLQDVPGDYTLA